MSDSEQDTSSSSIASSASSTPSDREDSDLQVSFEVPLQRPIRQKVLPAKLRENEARLGGIGDEVYGELTRSVIVECAQTGKQHAVKVRDLSREDCGPLTKRDTIKGARLMLDCKGKTYPVTFLQFKEKSSSAGLEGKAKRRSSKTGRDENAAEKTGKKNARKIEAGVGKGLIRDRTNVIDVLDKAKTSVEPPLKKRKTVREGQSTSTTIDLDDTNKTDVVNPPATPITVLDNADKDLLINLARRLERLERMMATMMKMMETERQASVPECSTIKQEGSDCTENGVNLMRIPARDAYSYGLQLMDILFTKEELSKSLLFKSKKSDKPSLEQERVSRLLGYIDKRYGDQWDVKCFTSKANQKCRDSKA